MCVKSKKSFDVLDLESKRSGSLDNSTALDAYLRPFQLIFAESGVSEICINRPGEIWIEQHGNFKKQLMPELTLDFLLQLACLVGEYNQREISPEQPILSSVLPGGSRVQFIMEPACEKGSFVCSIRRKSIGKTQLNDYFLPQYAVQKSHQKQTLSQQEQNLLRLYREENYVDFLVAAVLARKNILISGGTSTGKTTFLNALLQHIPAHERLITIETDREVQSAHANTVYLLA